MIISYYTAGPRTWPSSRLRAYMVGDVLEQWGHTVWYNPPDASHSDVIVLQKRFDLNERIAGWRNAGARVFFDVDDYMPDGPALLVDTVTVDTSAKLDLYPGAVIVPDCLDIQADSPRKMAHNENLRRVVWFGSADNVYHITNAAEATRRLGLEFIIITDLERHPVGQAHGVTGVQWSLSNVDQYIVEADLVVCPYVFTGKWGKAWVQSKSANRVLKAWGLGMPVAATPIPSYVEIGTQHFASTVDDWLITLRGLMDQEARERDASRGWRIAQQYRAEQIASQWLRVFDIQVITA
jgi:hypothetical protein